MAWSDKEIEPTRGQPLKPDPKKLLGVLKGYRDSARATIQIHSVHEESQYLLGAAVARVDAYQKAIDAVVQEFGVTECDTP
jgi:hypothetical protein